jgi:adenylosuccinate lyase/3-carboxy-cis,cis-muconate cycloisomerase
MLRGRIPLIAEAMERMDEGDSAATNVTDATVPEIAILAVSAAATLGVLVQGLAVHPEAMARNLGLSEGLIASEAVMMALSPKLGRHAAHQLLYNVAQTAQTEGKSFADALRAHPLLSDVPQVRLDALLDPTLYTGRSAEFARTARCSSQAHNAMMTCTVPDAQDES